MQDFTHLLEPADCRYRRRGTAGSPSPLVGEGGRAKLGRMRGAPAWHRPHSVQHPSTVLALRANPPSPTRGEGRRGGADLASWNLRR
ncbi:MAG: hypothetical protein E5Y18_00245 [Mesorhizobium sp.]|nr:MAG: hypothetical protein E5Y18_00245 [Mesorhizobium sp.]